MDDLVAHLDPALPHVPPPKELALLGLRCSPHCESSRMRESSLRCNAGRPVAHSSASSINATSLNPASIQWSLSWAPAVTLSIMSTARANSTGLSVAPCLTPALDVTERVLQRAMLSALPENSSRSKPGLLWMGLLQSVLDELSKLESVNVIKGRSDIQLINSAHCP